MENMETTENQTNEIKSNGFFDATKKVLHGTKNKVVGLFNRIANTKIVSGVNNKVNAEDKAYPEKASSGADFLKKFGLQGLSVNAAFDFALKMKNKIVNGAKNLSNKHPKISKVLKTIGIIGCALATAFVLTKVIMIAIAIFPEVLAAFMTVLAAIIVVFFITSIMEVGLNLN